MAQNKEFPVYLFTGFLESGKTLFLQDTLQDKRVNSGEKTLLLVCEDGEEEYDASRFSSPNVFKRVIEDIEDLTEENLSRFVRETGATRAFVEYNGMWMLQSFYDAMPENWVPYQNMLFFDANTIVSYNANMRSLVFDKLQNADSIIFNRVPNGADIMPYHKIVRGVSRRAEIVYEFTDGSIQPDEIVDPMPFDINAPVIELEDRDFALWYQDITEDMKKYDGKTIRFKAVCATNPKFPDKMFVAGRHVMTCCADDIAYCGFVTKWANADTIENAQWIMLTAKIDIRFSRLYGRRGPILNCISAESCEPLTGDDRVASFY
ncbi:MAG: GTPase [Clostridia bacterium]|nr:GTPase [Clostridia bacterium]